MFKIGWKIKLVIGLILASVILYTGAYIGLHEPDKVLFYIIIDLAFVPIEILIVVLGIEEIIEKKEKEAVLDKLDMILGVFFSEIGNDLLETFSKVNLQNKEIIKNIQNIDKWDDKDFKEAYKYLKNNGITFQPNIPEDEVKPFINYLRTTLQQKRIFLIDLLENPNIIEKHSFSNLLLALFHLDDELEHRTDLNKINSLDYQHLIADINRVYCNLTYEWIKYLQFLNKNYPYMSSIAIRTNPFDPNRSIYVTD